MNKMSKEEYFVTLKAARNAWLVVMAAVVVWMFVSLAKGVMPTTQICLIAGTVAVFWVSKSIMQGKKK